MIRAIRPSAMAQDDASLVAGWNVAPNLAYTLLLLPGASSCGVYLYDADGSTLVASGAALAGTDQPCVLIPQTGQTVDMVDADLGWHLLLTTTGTESQRTIRLGPAVDLPDEIHPVYGDDDMAVARATAAIDEAAHYIDDVTVTCPLGLGAGLGDVVSVPVDGVAVVGEVESITWTATPDGASDLAAIRRHVAIAPEAFVEPVPPTPPTLAADTASTDAATEASGNVLDNDDTGLTVVAVNGLSGNVGSAVAGSAGGLFTINSDGSWVFDPDGDFDEIEEDTDTAVTYYASDGEAEASTTLTVTVSPVTSGLWSPANIVTSLWLDGADSDTVVLNGSTVSQWSDKSGNGRHIIQGTAAKQAIRIPNGLHFDGTRTMGTASWAPANSCSVFVVLANARETLGSGIIDAVVANSPFPASPSNKGLSFNSFNSWGSLTQRQFFQEVFASGTRSIYKNGLISGTQSDKYLTYEETCIATAHHDSTDSVSGRYFTLGMLQVGSSYYYGKNYIFEVIVIEDGADTALSQIIEGYLAHKWGLAAYLPTDHPYKSTAPTI